MRNAVLYHETSPARGGGGGGGGGGHIGALKNVFKTHQQSRYLQALEEAKPGDGVGYPNDYTGERIRVNNAFLKQCKLLRPQSQAFRLNSHVVVKTGDRARMSEAAAMRLLSERTSLPIPKVYDAYVQHDGCGVIIMEYIDGTPLDHAWPHYDLAQKQCILIQLRNYLTELRSITSHVISSVDGQPCCDQFFAADSFAYGPYSDEDAFKEGLLYALAQRGHQPGYFIISRLLRSMRSTNIVMTHNDLTPSNILVRDGMVVGLLDWEMCGFYPDYWEYAKSYLFADWNTSWVMDHLPDKILTPRLSELSYLLHARDSMRPDTQ